MCMLGAGRCIPFSLVRLISLLMICRCLDVRSEPVDPSASSQCLKEIVPHAGYRVSFQELQDFYLVVQINCAGFARARQFSLVIGGKTTSVSECESDLLEVPVRIYRGNLAWKYVVDREDGTVEKTEFQFSALPLHEPSISFSFPSPGFSFRKGVPFFFISQLSEQEEAHEFGYPRFFLEISLTSVSDDERFFRFTWGSEKQLSLDNYVQPSQSMVVMEDVDFPVGNYTLNIRLLDGYKQFSGAETSMTVEINQQLDYVPYESDFRVADCQEEGNIDERCRNGSVVEGCGHNMLRDASWLPTIDPLHSTHRCANTLAFTERVEELYKVIRSDQRSLHGITLTMCRRWMMSSNLLMLPIANLLFALGMLSYPQLASQESDMLWAEATSRVPLEPTFGLFCLLSRAVWRSRNNSCLRDTGNT